MRKKVLIGILLLLLLDYAALDDITTGKEPSYTLEYAFVFISLPVLIFLGTLLFRPRRN